MLSSKGIICAELVEVLGTKNSDKNTYSSTITRDEYVKMFKQSPRKGVIVLEDTCDTYVYVKTIDKEYVNMCPYKNSKRQRN